MSFSHVVNSTSQLNLTDDGEIINNGQSLNMISLDNLNK